MTTILEKLLDPSSLTKADIRPIYAQLSQIVRQLSNPAFIQGAPCQVLTSLLCRALLNGTRNNILALCYVSTPELTELIISLVRAFAAGPPHAAIHQQLAGGGYTQLLKALAAFVALRGVPAVRAGAAGLQLVSNMVTGAVDSSIVKSVLRGGVVEAAAEVVKAVAEVKGEGKGMLAIPAVYSSFFAIWTAVFASADDDGVFAAEILNEVDYETWKDVFEACRHHDGPLSFAIPFLGQICYLGRATVAAFLKPLVQAEMKDSISEAAFERDTIRTVCTLTCAAFDQSPAPAPSTPASTPAPTKGIRASSGAIEAFVDACSVVFSTRSTIDGLVGTTPAPLPAEAAPVTTLPALFAHPTPLSLSIPEDDRAFASYTPRAHLDPDTGAQVAEDVHPGYLLPPARQAAAAWAAALCRSETWPSRDALPAMPIVRAAAGVELARAAASLARSAGPEQRKIACADGALVEAAALLWRQAASVEYVPGEAEGTFMRARGWSAELGVRLLDSVGKEITRQDMAQVGLKLKEKQGKDVSLVRASFTLALASLLDLVTSLIQLNPWGADEAVALGLVRLASSCLADDDASATLRENATLLLRALTTGVPGGVVELEAVQGVAEHEADKVRVKPQGLEDDEEDEMVL